MASSRPFWTTNQNPDAAKMTKDMVAKLDALDKALSLTTVDAAAVAAALQDVNRGCDSCHALYREGNEQTGYRIKSSR
jgi:cytochrome c556